MGELPIPKMAKSLLDYSHTPPRPQNARIVHFDVHGRPVSNRSVEEARTVYLQRQKAMAEQQRRRRAIQQADHVVPLSSFGLRLIQE